MQYNLAEGVQQTPSGKHQVTVGGHAADTAERWMKGFLVVAVLSLIGGFISGGKLFAIERIYSESFNYGAGIALGIGSALPWLVPVAILRLLPQAIEHLGAAGLAGPAPLVCASCRYRTGVPSLFCRVDVRTNM